MKTRPGRSQPGITGNFNSTAHTSSSWTIHRTPKTPLVVNIYLRMTYGRSRAAGCNSYRDNFRSDKHSFRSRQGFQHSEFIPGSVDHHAVPPSFIRSALRSSTDHDDSFTMNDATMVVLIHSSRIDAHRLISSLRSSQRFRWSPGTSFVRGPFKEDASHVCHPYKGRGP